MSSIRKITDLVSALDPYIVAQVDQSISALSLDITSEVIAARNAGNVDGAANDLAERLRWLQGNDIYAAEAYGFSESNTAADNTTALGLAIDAARVANGVVTIGAGIFQVNGIVLAGDDVSIIGAGQPEINAAGSALTGGTILKGGAIQINDKKRILIMNLGVDRSSGGGDCIDSGTDGTAPQYVKIYNVTTMSNGGSATHGCVLTSGSHNVVHNFKAYDCGHGLVFRCSYSTASNIYTQDCISSTMTIKAIDSINAYGNVVNNVVGYGTSTYLQGAFIVEAHNAAVCSFNNVSNVYIKNATFGLQYKSVDGGSGHGTTTRNNFSDFSFEIIQFDCVRIQGSDANVTQAHFTNFVCRQPGAYSFRNLLTTSDTFHIRQSVSSFAGQGDYSGLFFTREINGRQERFANVSRTTVQSIPNNVWTVVTHDELKDETDGTMWDAVTNPDRLTVPRNGHWAVTARAVFEEDATGRRGVRIIRSQDGFVVDEDIRMPVTGDSTTLLATWTQNMNSGTYYTMEVLQDSGAPLNLETQYYFKVELLA